MNQETFDPHARILHSGQYSIKKTQTVPVPIKSFYMTLDEEQAVQRRIDEMHHEIRGLEEQILEKRRISLEQSDKILEQVKDEARKVMEEAEQHAFDRVQKSVHEKDELLQKTHEDADRIIIKAQKEADQIISDTEKETITIREQARKAGHENGYHEGLQASRNEVDFAVERLHSIVAETARERERILVHSEEQVINLILTMVSKIVKRLTAEQREIVIENAKSALELLRSAMTIFIRVSPLDFNYVQTFKEELVSKIENRADIKFIEDPTVDPGGVYIESDTGDIDATIRSQLEELENQMRFYMPVKVKTPESKRREKIEENSKNKDSDHSTSQKNQEIPKTKFAEREEFISEPSKMDHYQSDKGHSEKKNDPISKEDKNNAIKDDPAAIIPEIVDDNDMENDPIQQNYVVDSYKENTDHTNDSSQSDDVII